MNKVTIKLTATENRVVVDGVDLTGVVSGLRLESRAGEKIVSLLIVSNNVSVEVSAEVRAKISELKIPAGDDQGDVLGAALPGLDASGVLRQIASGLEQIRKLNERTL